MGEQILRPSEHTGEFAVAAVLSHPYAAPVRVTIAGVNVISQLREIALAETREEAAYLEGRALANLLASIVMNNSRAFRPRTMVAKGEVKIQRGKFGVAVDTG